MSRTFLKISLIAAVSGFCASIHAQTNVWHDDFDQFPVGANSQDTNNPPYGAVAFNFTAPGFGNPRVIITNNNPDTLNGYSGTNNCAFIVNTDPSVWTNVLNFGLRINRIQAHGNTNTDLRAYTLSFDIAVSGGTSISGIGGFIAPSFGIYGNNSGEYFGDGCETNISTAFFPAVGTGYQHVSVPLASFNTAHATLLNPTDNTLSFFMAFYMAGHSYPGDVEIDLANMSITMSNPPPPPPPILTILPAKPGLRVFGKNFSATYNQEGFGTVNTSQSWIGVATPANPVSYSITFGSFDTVNNYTLYAQFLQNGNPGDPFGVYNGQNAFVWQITHQGSGFTTRIDWKTNAPTGNTINNALPLTATTSLNGRGTWTLTFTSDTAGTVTAPDGTSASFTLPSDPGWAAHFANPLIIDFATAPNSTAGYGQYIDISKIAISNVVSGTQYDDLTQDATLNTSLWNPGFSLDAGSVVQVPPDAAYWLAWTMPDNGFGLGTKAKLTDDTWYSPGYWNGLVPVTTQEGPTLKWTLIETPSLPTVDGGQYFSPPSTNSSFFLLMNPPPAQ